ncbi:SPOR domain-containing protein [Xanthomonas sp. D-109]|uniref:SPOR domain-containing protein n=1 Tax=Xanthomonas sp. D-109 TaxID=2821274 RepID=UPI001ADC15AF|nr:SPOR domain-containing protein [Xanthomonas sp. D-109]MBO9880636.1 SPOR domain-containing protein [Xanthomonas sp. D-109]
MAARRGKTQARRNTGNGTPGWVWLIAGAAIAAVVFLGAPGLFKKDGDFLRVGGPRANPDAQPAPVADADVDAAPELPKPAANAAGSTKPEAKKDAQTQYDFYTLLPGKEVQMSDAELAASARAEAIRQAKAQAAAGTAAGGTTPAAVATAPTATAANPTPLPETPSAAASATPAASRPAAAAATPAATTAPAAAAAAAAPDTARYILQAGSFGASGDAESTKAKLAMLGLSARVESAQISGKTVYRVRMGPYGTASELAEAKQKLNGSGLSAIAIKAQ